MSWFFKQYDITKIEEKFMEKIDDFYKAITDIIDKFGYSNLIFKSEAQFQFTLAWELQKKFDKYIVSLENLSAIASFDGTRTMIKGERKGEIISVTKTKKFFTDILLKNGIGDFVAIELKYKTKEDDINYLSEHGATDLGRFDYLWDLMRVQMLKTNNKNCYEQIKTIDCDSKKMICGFSVILTNEPNYWKITTAKSQKKNGTFPLYKNFCIGEGQVINSNNKLEWNKNKPSTCVDGTWREKVIIEFSNSHNCYWRKYGSNNLFNYLILDTNGNEPIPADDFMFFRQ